ncbi:mechanosensitive ion channel family protein [Marinilongibacter aquaticus]|uniref:mechanosensitive ion channel family protein n=1 Tax=Marinilongibacter aquaticus TaxID=2975157 RepID=UPI0021BD9B25|nr:mechanosensitive ion channel domain-containing protein [Marinilongibacter aquaticus]UBM60305.1 mechanosensitive ion channel family protein [Marinilongibacter aquaticus]
MPKLSTHLGDTFTLALFLIVVVITSTVATLVGRYLKHLVEKKSQDENVDITSFVFLKHAVVSTIYFLGLGWALLILPISKTFAHSLFAGAGATTLILGFASQQILSNLLSGVFILLKKPFRINDIIEIQGNRGKVLELDLHATTIENENQERVIIPNSLISNGIIKNTTRK